MDRSKPPPAYVSRRQALALAFGGGQWFPAALKAAPPTTRVRLAISESLVFPNVNLDDARAAMRIWLKRVMVDLNVVFELSPNVFDTTEEILQRARIGDFDAVALNVIEYRQIAEFLDSSQIITPQGAAGMDRYLLLAKRDSEILRLADLKGRNLLVLKDPKMCVADAWLSTILADSGRGPSEQFFRSVTEETKPAQVILPVFFGRVDACLTFGHSFDTMCELNPQVGKALIPIAASPEMTVILCVFRKNYPGAGRDVFTKVYTNLHNSASGRQVEALFQFVGAESRNASCLAPALAILEKAAHIRGLGRPGSRKG